MRPFSSALLCYMGLEKKALTSLCSWFAAAFMDGVDSLNWKDLLFHLWNRDILSQFTDMFCSYEGLLLG